MALCKILIVALCVIAAHVFVQNAYMSYCKRNIIVYFFMKESAMCSVMEVVLKSAEEYGLCILHAMVGGGLEALKGALSIHI